MFLQIKNYCKHTVGLMRKFELLIPTHLFRYGNEENTRHFQKTYQFYVTTKIFIEQKIYNFLPSLYDFSLLGHLLQLAIFFNVRVPYNHENQSLP